MGDPCQAQPRTGPTKTNRMFSRLKELLLGSPLPTYEQAVERLNKVRALAAFSPDALSSIAYANQEIYLGLVVAGAAGLGFAFPIGLAIVGLLVIVALSYSQTILGYPSGGGSYIVARENLGTLPGLVAAAALMIDYVLTAAVSLTAGVDAIASAFPPCFLSASSSPWGCCCCSPWPTCAACARPAR